MTDFAGNLFLRLAAEGRLVLKPRVVDEAIAGLERTLSQVQAQLRIVRAACRPTGGNGGHAVTENIVEAEFAEQLAPGRLAQAAVELPKYIEALRRARRFVPEDEVKDL